MRKANRINEITIIIGKMDLQILFDSDKDSVGKKISGQRIFSSQENREKIDQFFDHFFFVDRFVSEMNENENELTLTIKFI